MRKLWQKLMDHKKWLIIGIVAIAAIKVGVDFQASRVNAAAVTPKLTTVERGDVVALVSATGTIQPVNQVDISSKITGQLKEVRVSENDQVKKGQVLVVLDDSRLKAQVTQVQEKLNNTAAKFERNKRLHSIGAVSVQELDNSRMEYNVALANYDEVISQLNESVITSPIDGVVIGKPLPAGQMVAQGISNPMVILTVADMSKMQIEAQVDETDIGKVAVGQTVSFTVDTYQGKTFTGIVSKVSQKATTTQNVVYYTVTVDIHDAGNLLKPAMTARLSIHAGESKNTLTVPLAAIKTDPKQQQYVIAYRNNGKQENVNVTTGIIGEDKVEITSGINEGEKIVLAQSQAKQTKQTGGFPPGMGGGRR